MRTVRIVFWLGLVGAIVLAACGGDVSLGSLDSSSGLNPTAQLTLEEAEQIAETFLRAWRESDYEAMYSLISPNAREAYTLESFSNEYSDAATKLTLNELETHTDSSLRQGTTAVIMYDVTFKTASFGDVQDPERTMRLIETPEGWRVAWSRMDIFAELAEGARLSLDANQPGRGNIYDRNGNVIADQNGQMVELYIVRQDLTNEDACIQALSRILVLETGDIQKKFAAFSLETRFLVGQVDPETYNTEAQALLQLCAIGDDNADTNTRSARRYYKDLAPHLIGYVGQIQPEQQEEYAKLGYPDGALVGQAGIEASYESYLAGKIGATLRIIAPTGEVLRTIASSESEPGQSIYLTIDRDLQAGVQQAFVEAYDLAAPTWAKTSPGAAAVVMDVNTGEILASASYPSFDVTLFDPNSNAFNRQQEISALNSDSRRPLLNRVTQAQLPPGSTFKIISMAAGLDSGVFNANTVRTCNGIWYGGQYGDGVESRTDWYYPNAHGSINFEKALTYSCDPYFWELGVALYNDDPDSLFKYATLMGLGSPTGQDVLQEGAGLVPDEASHLQMHGSQWGLGSMLNMVIGQGDVQATPLQMVRMTAAIANGGSLYKPQFVSKIGLIGDEPVYTMQPEETSNLGFDASVYEAIQKAMCDVTLDPNGTARFIFEDWYDWEENEPIVCGKTGTAQTGGETTAPEAWFVSFAPQDNPEIAIVVVVENSCEGSEVSAPITRRIIEDYYHLPHSEWPPLWQSGCSTIGTQ
ncbi:MAG TPA: penicillin-binding transpeptidase domain-containing protein [Aggregatilinea sp.]|uniref:penicillin-binding transpeptidase domain-containing protein n=1 Tax=Aggregatilinea sp. TaxID=2806333 RepID=UPI002CB0F49C|nr:penicillin-binding transpeptidase domain-containing protein [Aggregatilinea sp.]HML23795.1 penicillin-binding transpeptidase domain-containing protein [Aggregatilinea sp.]